MTEKLIVDASRLGPEGDVLEGEVDVVDIREEFVRPFGGVRYRLTAQLFGKELLVRGTLEQDFDDTVKVDDFVFSCEIDEKAPDVDLTEDVRESIILALPTYPVCSETCPGIERRAQLPADDRWNVLDNLVKKEKGKDGQS